MWKDSIGERYWWHEVKDQVDELLFELAKAEDEEEIGFYLLNLHLNSKQDYACFSKVQAKEIRTLLQQLVNDTFRHQKLLAEIVNEIKDIRDLHLESDSGKKGI